MQAAKKIFKLNSKNNLCKFIGKCNYDGAANTRKNQCLSSNSQYIMAKLLTYKTYAW